MLPAERLHMTDPMQTDLVQIEDTQGVVIQAGGIQAENEQVEFAQTVEEINLKHYIAFLSHRSTDHEFAEMLLKKVGLYEKRDYYPCNLSGGQQQRVAIARALALHPDILCFDEPTSALDPELTGEVLNVIRGLKSSDSTMIVVTHEIGFAHDVADKIIFMDNGFIEEDGTPCQVIDNPSSERTKEFLARFNQFGD